MSDQADLVTRIVDRVLDVLFAKYPARTGLGVVLGGTFAFLARLFEPSIRSIAAIDATGAPLWGWLALGILILHIPTIRGLFKQQPIGDDVIDQALDLIERSNFTQKSDRTSVDIDRVQKFHPTGSSQCRALAGKPGQALEAWMVSSVA
jgi:hypothetical protein